MIQVGSIVWLSDPGARVAHVVKEILQDQDGDDVVMMCGTVYAMRELRLAEPYEPLHERCSKVTP